MLFTNQPSLDNGSMCNLGNYMAKIKYMHSRTGNLPRMYTIEPVLVTLMHFTSSAPGLFK